MGEPERKEISLEEWQKNLDQIKVTKYDLNKVIMNYLIIEGYIDAAEAFKAEADVQEILEYGSIEERMKIRRAIQVGNIDEAIERTNDIDPEILDTNPELYFQLQLQKFIELIKQKQKDEALIFSQQELGPRGEENQNLLKSLEKAMMLLLDQEEGPYTYLLDYSQRLKVASALNAAILSAQALDKEPALPNLLKLMCWSQNALEETCSFPKLINFINPTLIQPQKDDDDIDSET